MQHWSATQWAAAIRRLPETCRPGRPERAAPSARSSAKWLLQEHPDLTNDPELQAVIWYREKRLYDAGNT
jgi:hypothetical protein